MSVDTANIDDINLNTTRAPIAGVNPVADRSLHTDHAPHTHSAPQQDLAAIMGAFNQVTENLSRSHEALQQQVARLQSELASTDAQLQRSKRLAALGEMAAGIAHEIRNPLAAIQLYAGMLVEDLDPKKPFQYTCVSHEPTVRLESSGDPKSCSLPQSNSKPAITSTAGSATTARKIESAVRGLNAIVTDVLSFAREIQPRHQWVRIDELLDQAVEASSPAITAAGIEVHRPLCHDNVDAVSSHDNDGDTHRRPLTPHMAWLDPALIHQALLNLIRNAIDAMTSESSATRPSWDTTENVTENTAENTSEKTTEKMPNALTLSARREGSQTVLTVRDTGSGIARQQIDRIFNPFFTTRSTGTGLGLAIVHRIVDAHGGGVNVFNDAGAVFELNLPRPTDDTLRSQPANDSPNRILSEASHP